MIRRPPRSTHRGSSAASDVYKRQDYIRRKILRQTDSEINEEDKLIASEREAGLIPPTEQELQMAQMAMDAQGNKDNLGKPINEPEIDTSKTEDPEAPKGGEI